jgi:hypothetical protein
VTVTTWPDGQALLEWVGPDTLSDSSAALADELVADATDAVLDRIDTDKLPADPEECPRAIRRAIILEAARLLLRRGSAHGMVSFGEFALRLGAVDVDIERLLRPWRLGAEA